MTTWWWVRHGPTHAKAAVGWTDLPADLSDTAALSRLDAHLPRNAHCLSSDLCRARDTLSAIRGERHHLGEDDGIREIHFGAWEGLGFPEISARDPDLARRFWDDPGSVAPPDGESWERFAARVDAVIDRLNGTAEHIVAVAHFAVILAAVARAGGFSPAMAFRFRVQPLSVTELSWLGEDRWAIGAVNHRP